jgi:hypothetical protein
VCEVKNIDLPFKGKSHNNEDLSQWDVSNVISMTKMFAGAQSFKCVIRNWNMRQVTDMRGLPHAHENLFVWKIINNPCLTTQVVVPEVRRVVQNTGWHSVQLCSNRKVAYVMSLVMRVSCRLPGCPLSGGCGL